MGATWTPFNRIWAPLGLEELKRDPKLPRGDPKDSKRDPKAPNMGLEEPKRVKCGPKVSKREPKAPQKAHVGSLLAPFELHLGSILRIGNGSRKWGLQLGTHKIQSEDMR